MIPQCPDLDSPRVWVSGKGATRVMPSLRERLAAAIDKRGPDECWPWTKGHDGKGYGKLAANGVRYTVTRLVFWIEHGHWPDIARHTCDNPPCCNPRHLIDGTYADNARDRDERSRNGYAHRTHCNHGHLFPTGDAILRNTKGYRYCGICDAKRGRDKRKEQRMARERQLDRAIRINSRES